MHIRSAMAIVVIASAASIGGGLTALASTHPGTSTTPRTAPTPRGGRAATAAATVAQPEAKYVAVTPCRIVDTRAGGGLVRKGAPRSFIAVGDTGFTGQGGRSGGCGIPAAATAIQANIVAVGGSGSGWLKAYPRGATPLLSSSIDFSDGRAIANGGVLPVNTSGTLNFTVAVSRATQVVVDVSGYFVAPMWALVNGDGTLIRGSRVTGVTPFSIGEYQVDFDRDVSGCSYSVVPWHLDFFGAQPASNDVNGVFVSFIREDQGDDLTEFYLTVTC